MIIPFHEKRNIKGHFPKSTVKRRSSQRTNCCSNQGINGNWNVEFYMGNIAYKSLSFSHRYTTNPLGTRKNRYKKARTARYECIPLGSKRSLGDWMGTMKLSSGIPRGDFRCVPSPNMESNK
ncbi:hypothetical protein CEXT_585821 [Caerostris extrusa]|uniref:Uncharacterized protein n=1 Tax=Caerostris extrusa TaxID=172846 RepID=A0AAV4Y9Z5_CAEEX|nr:hypothetical protein CEXT_585821 [Caerostris extrusa]